MSTNTRIYVVSDLDSDPVAHKLVRARDRSQAIAHVVGTRFVADVANQDSLVSLTAEGVKVQTAGEKPLIDIPPASAPPAPDGDGGVCGEGGAASATALASA